MERCWQKHLFDGLFLFLSSPFIHTIFSPESLEVHSLFTWVGQTQYKLQLKPQEVLCLTLRACFLQAGVYNLNTPRVFAKPSEQGAMCETSQQTASPALIIIINVWVEHGLFTGGPGNHWAQSSTLMTTPFLFHYYWTEGNTDDLYQSFKYVKMYSL